MTIGESNHQDTVLNKYKNTNLDVVHTLSKVSHDGYDNLGPQSNLYDFIVFYRKDNNMCIDIWHREYWYNGEDNEEYQKLNNINGYVKYLFRNNNF